MGKTSNGNGYCEKLENGKWKCVVSVIIDNKRKRFSATSTRKKDAEAEAQKKAELYRKSILINKSDPKSELKKTFKMSFLEFWEDYKITRSLSSTTIYNYEKLIYSSLFNCVDNLDMPLHKIDISFYNDIIKVINEKYKYTVGKRLRNFLKGHYKYLVKNSIFMYDLWDNVNPVVVNKQKQEFTIDNIAEVEDKCEIFAEDEILKIKAEVYTLADINGMCEYDKNRYLAYKQDCKMFYLMFLLGVRGGELKALTINDIDFTNKTLKISKALALHKNAQGKTETIVKPPKTKHSNRLIGLNNEELTLFKELIDSRINKDNVIIFQGKNGYLSSDDFKFRFLRMLKNLNIEKGSRSPHSFRHSFISYSIDNNAISPLKNKSIIFISKYVGHDKLSTTLDVYTHIAKHKITDIETDIASIDELEYK